MGSLANIEDQNCTKCNLHNGCSYVCMMGEGDPNADLMIVGDYPSESDERGDSGFLMQNKYKTLWYVLDKAIGYDISKTYRTYLVKCRPANSKTPTDQEAQVCYQYLRKEIEAVRPKAILLIGEMALNFVAKETKISDCRGNVYEISLKFGDEMFTTKCVPVYSPAYVERAQNKLEEFAKDVYKAVLESQGLSVKMDEGTQLVDCKTVEQVEEMIGYIEQVGECAVDVETNEVDDAKQYENLYCTCISFSFQHGSSWVIPLQHHETPFTPEQMDYILQQLKVRVLENRNIAKIGQNIKYDMHVLWAWKKIDFKGPIHDTMLMHHALDNTRLHGLKEWGPELYPNFKDYEKDRAKYPWSATPWEIMLPYSGTDTDLTYRGYSHFLNKLMEDERLYVLYRNLICAVFKPLFYAEREGMLVNKEMVLKGIAEVEAIMKQQEQKLLSFKQVKRFIAHARDKANDKKATEYEDAALAHLEKYEETQKKMCLTNAKKARDKANEIRAGLKVVYKGFNVGSNDQIAELMYTKEGFNFRVPQTRKKRKSNKDPTGKKELKSLGDKSGFVEELLIWRALDKIKGTYLEGLYKRLDSHDYVHTTFKQQGTETGRLSSANPNLQNLPNLSKIVNEYVKMAVQLVKRAFSAPPGHGIMQADFSQAELRLIAEYAGVERMIYAYSNDIDLHIVTASEVIMRISIEEFMKQDKETRTKNRTNAKAGNFGLIYGMQEQGFMEYAKDNYGVTFTFEEAKAIRDAFFDTYPELEDYYETYIQKCKKFGYVRTFFGRKRFIPDIHLQDDYLRAFAERAAINTPIQGTAGEFTLFAIALLALRLPPQVRVVNTVHDSIILYYPLGMEQEVAKIVKDTCENLPTLQFFGKELKRVKMAVDIEISTKNWKELEKIEILG